MEKLTQAITAQHRLTDSIGQQQALQLLTEEKSCGSAQPKVTTTDVRAAPIATASTTARISSN